MRMKASDYLAQYLTAQGRQGLVWLDIPQNVQNADIDTNDLVGFHSTEMQNMVSLG